ncbi:Asp23/Gls24 family envelope stress response protein [Microbacterium sp. SORGH_AS_0888]|uniref:Asp23/Gls24 family envelope stress response protein n=1 Tax=Microbacterium sp. SORGH_AS_0888 TaxID=3041791 RepID=UPI002783DB75|nr:Asp23/Gls24 family envelope stress response protein [Microbacterium sp. SORGH_AS_0888]MDQ1131205.1 hypothetical protein [Microbacterium sp. SORGH_AS_0888]
MTEQERDIGGSGYTLEDLSAYLDRGRTPAIAAIERNPECQAVLASMERLSALSREMIAQDTQEAPARSWFDGILQEVTREVRAGRDLPIGGDETTSLLVTEGALREVARRAGDAVPGVLVGRVRVTDEPEGAVALSVAVSVAYGFVIPDAAQRVREAVATAVEDLTTLRVLKVDVTVVDVEEEGR